jgi:hypothetical protein
MIQPYLHTYNVVHPAFDLLPSQKIIFNARYAQGMHATATTWTAIQKYITPDMTPTEVYAALIANYREIGIEISSGDPRLPLDHEINSTQISMAIIGRNGCLALLQTPEGSRFPYNPDVEQRATMQAKIRTFTDEPDLEYVPKLFAHQKPEKALVSPPVNGKMLLAFMAELMEKPSTVTMLDIIRRQNADVAKMSDGELPDPEMMFQKICMSADREMQTFVQLGQDELDAYVYNHPHLGCVMVDMLLPVGRVSLYQLNYDDGRHIMLSPYTAPVLWDELMELRGGNVRAPLTSREIVWLMTRATTFS